jgi:hypothetical protein
MEEFGHPLAALIVLGMMTTVSSAAAWIPYKLTISKTTTVNPKNAAMMTVVVLTGILLFTLGR